MERLLCSIPTQQELNVDVSIGLPVNQISTMVTNFRLLMGCCRAAWAPMPWSVSKSMINQGLVNSHGLIFCGARAMFLNNDSNTSIIILNLGNSHSWAANGPLPRGMGAHALEYVEESTSTNEQ